MNYSKQREIVLNTLKENVVHPSAEYIYHALKKKNPKISLATVYRNLNKLAELGKVKKIEGLETSDHFDHNTHEHNHFICIKCGRIYDVPSHIAPKIIENTEKEMGFKVIQYEIALKGICKDCLGENNN